MIDTAFITSASLSFHTKLSEIEAVQIDTKFGPASMFFGNLAPGRRVASLARSDPHSPLMPHHVNYRANMLALQQIGVKRVFATSVVGGLRSTLPTGQLVLVDQFIDLTRHRHCTIFEDSGFHFVDFTEPYCPTLRQAVLQVAEARGVSIAPRGCYVGTDGPRYDTAAEIRMYALLGGDVIGHTNIPEAIFARELNICYATVAIVSNPGAGISNQEKHVLLEKINAAVQERGMLVMDILSEAALSLEASSTCTCIPITLSGAETLHQTIGTPNA